MYTILDGVGSSMKRNGGNSSFGSNGRFYWHTLGERSFYGNQYVRTFRFSYVGKEFTKVTGPVGKLLDGYDVVHGIALDYQDYQHGYTNCYNTVRATTNVVGGWAGAMFGATLGAKAGATIGTACGGIGAVPATIIGGSIGGIVGSFGGSWLGIQAINMIY